MRLQGKVALITGASQGIGAAIAERFARESAHLALCARTPQRQEWGQRIAAQVPLGRFGEPSEVAALALFPASDESTYVTGTCISIDGGKAAELYVPGM